jgi:hypothetical protein
VRVFLSSTYADLIGYRAAASQALERLGQQVGRMEVLGSRPDEPSKACAEEIDQCSIFVGIYAHRYGFIPAGSEISITELEFDHARKRGRQIFCFLADEGHPWPPAFVEDGSGREKLQRFKNRIRNLYAVDQFTTQDNLGSNVATSVGRFLAQFRESPSVNEATETVEDALVTGVAALSRNMAMLFVDLMRLLSVISSDAVRSANVARYNEFLDMADQRLLDLRSTYILFARYLTPKIIEQIHPLDSQLSWILLRLRRGPHLDTRSCNICIETLYEISKWVASLCELSFPGEYRAIRERVEAVTNAHSPDLSISSINEVFDLRLAIQSELVRSRHDLRSIIEDRHLKLAVEYFCLDRHLLSLCPIEAAD